MKQTRVKDEFVTENGGGGEEWLEDGGDGGREWLEDTGEDDEKWGEELEALEEGQMEEAASKVSISKCKNKPAA